MPAPRCLALSACLSLLLAPSLAFAQSAIIQSISLPDPLAVPSAPAPASLYRQAFDQAAALRAIAAEVPDGPAPTRIQKLGDQGPGVAWLIQALAARHYLPAPQDPSSPPKDVFDQDVETALRQFQREQGLVEDGVAGPSVFSVLGVSPARQADALESWGRSLQAWSQEIRHAGYGRMIVVNLASFTLHAINLDTDQVELESRVIVGSPATRTPRMLTRIVNLKANPDWSPPKSIRGARYQPPGPGNALGLMRFSTDNHQSIYLHDTNARHLFDRERRALSHGCVRVQLWQDLAAWAARQTHQWVDDVALAGGRTRFLKIEPIPVLLVYSRTDIVDGQPAVFPDVYGLGDQAIGGAALDGRPELPPALYGLPPVPGSMVVAP